MLVECSLLTQIPGRHSTIGVREIAVRFFKKKISVESFMLALAEFIAMTLQKVDGDVLLKKTTIDSEDAKFELLLLIAFSIECVTSIHLGDTPKRRALIDLMYEGMVKHLVVEGHEAEFLGMTEDRRRSYQATLAVEADVRSMGTSINK